MNGRELISALCGQENVIVIRRPFVEWLGHVSDALLLDQAMYRQDRAGDGEWWHQSDEDMSERICVPIRSLKRCRARLADAGLIETVRKGIPPRIHYRVDLQAVVDGLTAALSKRGQVAPTALPAGPDAKATWPPRSGQMAQPSIDEGGVEGGVEGERTVKTTPTSTTTPPNPPAQPPAPAHGNPTHSAGKPGAPGAERSVPTRGQGGEPTAGEHRSSSRQPARLATSEGSQATNRWHPVATAIMGVLGRPEPRGKPPAWLGNAVRTFGAAAGDDPAVALRLVAGWAVSRPLREALERGIVRDHTVPAMVGAWIVSGGGGKPPAGVKRQPDALDERMRAAGAPDNWRELVYTRDGTRIAATLVLPRLGLEPYTPLADWPEWFRVFEAVQA